MAKAMAKRSTKSAAESEARKSAAKTKSGKTARKSKPIKVLAKAKSSSKMVKSRTVKPSAKTKSAKAATESPKAVRLTFSYDGDKVKLISQLQVEMTVPPSDATKGFAQHKGFWAELKGQQDQTLYRHLMHNPTKNDAEVFSDDPEQSISRQPAPKRKGVFVVGFPIRIRAASKRS